MRSLALLTLIFPVATMLPHASLTAQDPVPAPAPAAVPVRDLSVQATGEALLRRAVAVADTVVTARHVRQTPFSNRLMLHTLEVLETLTTSGDALPTHITVVETVGVCRHEHPKPGDVHLYNLRDIGAQADRLGIPGDLRPCFKLQSHPGGNPKLVKPEDRSNDPYVTFAKLLLGSRDGVAPRTTVQGLLKVALGNTPETRIEAGQALAENELFRAEISNVAWSNLALRMAAEDGDIPFKIALAELCVLQPAADLDEALLVAIPRIEDPRWPRAAGRMLRFLHGEDAGNVVEAALRRGQKDATKARLIITLGATGTQRALGALLRMKSLDRGNPAIREALQVHGAPAARDAASTKK